MVCFIRAIDLILAYRDLPSLTYTFATIHEATRLRDIVMTLTELTAKDSFIPYTT